MAGCAGGDGAAGASCFACATEGGVAANASATERLSGCAVSSGFGFGFGFGCGAARTLVVVDGCGFGGCATGFDGSTGCGTEGKVLTMRTSIGLALTAGGDSSGVCASHASKAM